MNIALCGAGAWGTALARLLLSDRHQLRLWDWDQPNLQLMAATGRNEKYLPGIEVGTGFAVAADVAEAAAGAEVTILATRSSAFREVASVLGRSGYTGTVVSVTKGIEFESGLTMGGVLAAVAPRARHVALSGPTLAPEVARGIPTAAVAASHDATAARAAQQLFHRPTFRVYTSTDPTGVELGGALKNIMAIAAGISDGLGFGDNSKAALVTRAISEIRRLGVACGAQADTFTGLSGLGDLMVTCFSRHSRNRGFGERIGRGEKSKDIAASMLAVAEGYPTARSAYQLARKQGVITPVIDEVYAMLYEGKNAAQAVPDLMSRDLKSED